MDLGYRGVAVLVVAMGGALAVGYGVGRRNAEAPDAARVAHAKAGVPGKGGVVPAGHPAPGQSAEGPVEREGKVKVDPSQKFTHFRVGNKNVKSIYADGSVMWVGTSGGVIRYDTASEEFRMWDATTGLLSNGIFHVGKLQGRIVVGTYGGGMSLLDAKKGTWETYNVPEGLGDAFVYDVLEAKNGDVWVATWSGVNRIRGGALRDRSRWELHTVESTRGGLPNDWVYGLAEGRDGEMWLATEGGLARYRDGRWDNWNHAKGLGAPYDRVKADIRFKNDPSRYSTHHAKQKQEMGLQNVDVAYNPNYIVAIEVDREGIVWVGTWGGGLARFDGKAWRNYTVADGLPGNHVFMLHRDAKDRMWVGTDNGLALMSEGRFETMTTANGLFNNAVFSMTTGGSGDLWVGSYGGVALIRSGAGGKP